MTIEDFKPMIKMAVEDTVKSRTLIAYCDYIAYQIQKNLKALDTQNDKLLASVGTMKFDATDDGKFLSTKKTIMVEDRYGKQYRITVEEA